MDEGEHTPQAGESENSGGDIGDPSTTDEDLDDPRSSPADPDLDPATEEPDGSTERADPPNEDSNGSRRSYSDTDVDVNAGADADPDVGVDVDTDVPGDTDVDVGSGGRDRSSPDVDFDGVVLDDDDDDNQGLFDDLLSGEPIFENKEVLRPSYTPHELPHRNDQINRMATILVSALRGETPSNILIYGKTGTGKTASAKFVSQELESTSQKYDVPCEVEYINCEVTDTQYRVLAQLANTFIEKNQQVIANRLDRCRELRSAAVDDVGSLSGTEFATLEALDARIADLEDDADEMEEVPMTGWPTDRVYSTFFEAVDYHERVVVIMLDEIDKLVEKSGDDTLYNLSRMNSELEKSRISIMGISNDLKFTDFLDPRVKSSLGEEEIVFPPYDANQLRDILQHRADISFKQEALTDDVIPLCAAFAAQEHGDARRALDLLRTAGELAERSQAEIVAEKHVRQAQDKIELDRVVEVVRTLPTQSKIVLFAVILLEKNGVHNINTGEVFNIYKRLCEEIDADVLTQRRVTDLISELDMLGIVNAVVVSKGRYGRTKEMGLSVPVEETEAVLLSDSRLGDIENAQPFVQARFDN
ncbi:MULTISPECIES: Cdc6/Cdc18 family protein [unclassified Halorubrum]|uniref:Cdc6/Cdc18 family protein n=1 Tax=unclassified Halorubrum TaxID=2642239 RepID=UPI000B98A35F|nr:MULTISPECIES: orc1/cdc6 family replication initiation protein [unclassified Halorubrum]OYR44833.1 cell division control protein Cdc6 [Halorubrum sp. Eb13]OYR53138.1 cell division control protein Cdc6 [Halorubrum sp. Ea1]